MAKEYILKDDITGKKIPADTPHTEIYISGPGEARHVRLDLSPDSFKSLIESLTTYWDNGEPVAPKSQSGQQSDTAAIRKWARENGREVQDRGAIPAKLREDYELWKSTQLEGN
jgi:hypothetical protein